MSLPSIKSRSGGRTARKALRASKSAMQDRPARPGVPGGQYRPLSDRDVVKIHEAALEILETVGMGNPPPPLIQAANSSGLIISNDGRIRYPRSLVEDVIDGACRNFTLYGRTPEQDIYVTEKNVHYGNGGAAVQTLDIDTGVYRKSTLKDVYDFSRLADCLDYISWHSRNVVATDMPDNLLLDINTLYALLAGTSKNVATSITLADHVAPMLDILHDVAGGEDAFNARPFLQAHISPVVSPLRYGEDAVSVAAEIVKTNIPIHSVSAPQSGATSPAPLAGSLAQLHAEALGALVMFNLLSPGHPVIFSVWPLVIDLRTGAFAGGSGEGIIMGAAATQIAQHCNLMVGVPACMTDSKIPDAQAGYEKGMAALAMGLAGANLVYEASSMFGSLMGASFEGMVIDNELVGQALRCVRGIEVNDNTLSLDVIKSVVSGANHFLGEEQTLQSMERDYHYPRLADRETIESWQSAGGKDLRERAHEHARLLLSENFPKLIPDDVDQRIRAKYDIRLSPAAMRAKQ